MITASVGAYFLEFKINESRKNISSDFSFMNLTSELGNTFSSGSIQSFSINESAILLAGVGYYNRSTGYNLPSLMKLNSTNPSAIGEPMMSVAEKYFHNGTIFGSAWNGSAWMLTGESYNGVIDGGGAIIISGDVITNLTPQIEPYFNLGGAWFDAWNGTGWLIGGNNDKQAALVGLYHDKVINYTPLLGKLPMRSWIQLIVWNGTSWLIGGYQIFGFLTSGKYIDMLQKTEFLNSGVLAASFVNHRWYIGGGPPAGIQVLYPNGTTNTIQMPSYFNKWVNGITCYKGYFLVGGEAAPNSFEICPALYAINISAKEEMFCNLTSLLPSSFKHGQIQFIAYIQFKGVSGVMIAGQGSYNTSTGYSKGALSLMS
jgi:hypothetical protein